MQHRQRELFFSLARQENNLLDATWGCVSSAGQSALANGLLDLLDAAELMGKILNPLGVSYAVYLMWLGGMDWANRTRHWLAECYGPG